MSSRSPCGRAPTLSFLLSLVGCANTGEVEGRVVSYFDGAPVAGVQVGIGGTTLRATTDGDGRYRLEDVVPGPQKVSATGAAFTEATPLTLTVGVRSTVAAEDLRVLPRPPEPGVYALGETGALTKLAMPDGKPPFTQLVIGFDVGWAAPARALPESGMTAVSSPMTLLALDGDKPSTRITLSKPEKTPAVIDQMRGGPVVPAWLIRPNSSVPVGTERVRDGLHLLRATLNEGVYVLERKIEGGTYLTMFRVKPRGPVLAIKAGTYAEGSPEYATARDGLLAWCATPSTRSERAACSEAVALLGTASTDAACLGRLEIPDDGTRSARLTTGTCGAHVVVAYSHEDDGWYLDEVTVRPAETRTEGGEDPNREARQKAIDDMRRQAALQLLRDAAAEDGVGGE